MGMLTVLLLMWLLRGSFTRTTAGRTVRKICAVSEGHDASLGNNAPLEKWHVRAKALTNETNLSEITSRQKPVLRDN